MWAAGDTAMLGVKETLNDMYCCFPAVLAAKYVYLLLCTHSFWQVNRNLSHTIQIHHSRFLAILTIMKTCWHIVQRTVYLSAFLLFAFYSRFIFFMFITWLILIDINK